MFTVKQIKLIIRLGQGWRLRFFIIINLKIILIPSRFWLVLPKFTTSPVLGFAFDAATVSFAVVELSPLRHPYVLMIFKFSVGYWNFNSFIRWFKAEVCFHFRTFSNVRYVCNLHAWYTEKIKQSQNTPKGLISKQIEWRKVIRWKILMIFHYLQWLEQCKCKLVFLLLP